MNLHAWWLFMAAVFLLTGTPGPNMLHVLSRSVEIGMRRSVAAMAGCLAAVVTALAASAAGLSAFLLTLPSAFDTLRYVGVAYLFYIGVKAWRAEVPLIDVGGGDLLPQQSSAALFRGGFAIGISNPKLLLFAAAFLPQFVNPAAPQAPQFAILVASFAVVECLWYVVYAAGGRTLSRYLANVRMKRLFNRVTGAIFVGFGGLLLQVRAV